MATVEARVFGEAAEFGRSLRADLADARGLAVAVAFAKPSGLAEVDVEAWSRRGRSLKFLAGTDFAITELDLLKRLGQVPSAECRIYHSLGRARVFHPKIYLLDKGASRVVYVGSSNFTRGGLSENVEANVRLEGPSDAPEVVHADNIFAGLFDAEVATPVTEDFELRYRELQRALRAVQTYPMVADHAKRMAVAESLLLGEYRARASNARWLLVTSPENFATCLRAGVWGRQSEHEIRAYQRKDVFFFHVTGGRGIAAFGMFMGEPYHDETPLWRPDPRGRGVFPWRIRIHTFAVLQGGIPTKEVLEPLRPGAASHWFHGFIQQSHRLTPADFEALRTVFEAEARAERAAEPES